jgi:sigma-E factor negative regulatory protein RseB
MRPVASKWLLAVLLVWPAAFAHAAEAEDARQMLERMNTAMSQMDYQGTFVYVQGDDIETMRITHVADEKGVRERLYAVSGEPREILRDSGGVRWILANDQSVFQDPGFNLSFFPELPTDQRNLADDSYVLKVGREARIAGHQARNLQIIPRDGYRYGYSLWLETQTDLLLKWELIDSDRKPIAKLMFTDIRIGTEVDVKELKPTRELRKFKTVETQLPAGRGHASASPRWQPGKLPPGFHLTAHRFFGEKGSGVFEHLVYSDGLAAVSVYIESMMPDTKQRTGPSQLGTTNAFSRTDDEMLITVVGDVPAITVKSIGDAVNIDSGKR